MAIVDIDVGAGAGTFEAALRDPQGNPAGSASVIQVNDRALSRRRHLPLPL